jgi:cyclophilin family peptidyl-prolyl cis-trans isomerase
VTEFIHRASHRPAPTRLSSRHATTIVAAAMRRALFAACVVALFAGAPALDRSEAFIGYSERTPTPARTCLVMKTRVGDVVVQLRDDLSPDTTSYFRAFAKRHGAKCAGCAFHRAENIPPEGAIDIYGGPGPPYALVQGRLGDGARDDLRKESAPLVERGDVCVVGGGPDFFIATTGHHEWGGGHTVFGKVTERDMAIVEEITKLPKLTQVWGETHVTALATKLHFTLEIADAGARGSGLTDTGPRASMLRGNG